MFYHYPCALYFPQKRKHQGITKLIFVCESFAVGNIDALKTLEALHLNIMIIQYA